MNFDALDEFTRAFKKLERKYRSLSEDLEEFKDILKLSPEGTGSKFSVLHRSDEAVINRSTKYLTSRQREDMMFS